MAAFFTRLRRTLSAARNFSTILSPDSKTPLTSKQKTRAALTLLKSESNPEKIVEICRAAALTPDVHLDRVTFSAAVTKLSRSNNFSYISDLLSDLRNSRSDRFAAHAIVLFGQAGMLNEAVLTFKQFHEQSNDDSNNNPGSVKMLNSLLFAAVLAKDYNEVKRFFVEFSKLYNVEADLDTYNTVIKGFCESGNSSSVYSILAEMDRKGVVPNKLSFGNLLAGFYKEEKYEDVEKVLDLMKDKYGIPPGISTYNIRIQSLCKLRKAGEAKKLFDGIVSRGMKPNSNTYTHLIHGFCREGDLEEAKRLFWRMGREGCVPEAECYFTLVYFLCKGGEFETALGVCKESIEKGWVPNVSTMKILVNGLVGAGKADEAKELVGKMKEKFPKNVHIWDEVEAGFPQ